MSITSIKRDWGVSPSIVRMTSTDDLATITTAGYLDSERANIIAINDGDFQWDASDLILIYYEVNQWSFFSRAASNGLLTVVISGGSGDVQPFNIQQQTYTFADDDGSANAYHADYSPAIGAYVKGMRLTFNTVNANTNASTFAANGLGSNAIVLADGSALSGGEIPADSNVDLMLRDDGDWQLMGTSGAAGGVTSADVQSQAFTYAADSSTGPDAYVASFTPTMTNTDGTRFDVLINSTGGNTATNPTIDFGNGGPYNIKLNNPIEGTVAIGDITDGMIAQFEIFDGVAILLNPQVSIGVTPLDIQNQSYSYSEDDGIADVYHADYTPAIPVYVEGMRLTFLAGNSNAGPSTFAPNALVAQDIVLADGSQLSGGEITASSVVDVIMRDDGDWQLMGVVSSGGGITAVQIQEQAFVFDGSASNILDAYTVTTNPATAPFTLGSRISFKVPATNISTSPSIAVNGESPASIVNNANSGINIGDMVVNCNAELTLNTNGNWQLTNPASAGSVSPSQIQKQSFIYAVDSSVTPNLITVAFTPPITSYTDGLAVCIKAANNGSSGLTINVDGLGAVPVIGSDGSQLLDSPLVSVIAGDIYYFVYNTTTTDFQLISQGAFLTLGAANGIQRGYFNTTDDTGIADAYAGTFYLTPSAVVGTRLYLKIANTNATTTPTFDAGFGTKVITLNDGSAIAAGDMPAGGYSEMVYTTSPSDAWRLQNPSTATTTVTPADIQSEAFTYAVDSSTGPDAYVADYSPPLTSSDGTRFDVLINGTGTNTITTPTVTVNGTTYAIYLEDGSNIAVGDIVLGVIAQFQILQGNVFLQNPQTLLIPVTPAQIQSQAFTYSADSGAADAYVGTYTPALGMQPGTTVELSIANTNLTTSPTFDGGDGSGPLPIVLGDGSSPPIGSIPAGLKAIFINASSAWQIVNPVLTGAVPIVPSVFSAGLSGTQTIGTSTTDVILFDAVNTDTASAYNASTGEWTAPTTSYYNISVVITSLSSDLVNLPVITLLRAATPVKNGSPIATNTTAALISGNFHATAGDVFTVTCQNTSGTNSVVLQPGQQSTYWDISSINASTNTAAVGGIFYPTVNVTAAAIAAGGIVTVIAASSPTATYKVVNMFVNGVGSDGWTNGDRDIAIWDGTLVFGSLLSDFVLALNNNESATLLSNDFVTSNTQAHIEVGIDIGRPSTPGADIIVTYLTGSDDYDTGTLSISVAVVQMTL